MKKFKVPYLKNCRLYCYSLVPSDVNVLYGGQLFQTCSVFNIFFTSNFLEKISKKEKLFIVKFSYYSGLICHVLQYKTI